MTDVANVNPMAVAALVEADRIKVHDVSRGQDYTLTLSEVFDTMAADASSLAAIADYVQADAGALAAINTALVADTKALANALQASFKDGLLAVGTLDISATPEQFQTMTAAVYRIGSIQRTVAATASISFAAADTINTGAAAGQYWGAWLVQVTGGGTFSTKSVSADQVYATEAAAIAALPAPDAGNVALGYFTVQSNTDVDWVAGTDDLTPASDCAAANFYDGTPLTAFTAGPVS